MVQTTPSPGHHMISPHTFSQYSPIDKDKSGEVSNNVSTVRDYYGSLQKIESRLSSVGATDIATATANGTVNTFVTSNADASDVTIGDVLYLYRNFGTTLLEVERKVTNIQVDTPAVGSTTITFTPDAAQITETNDEFKDVVYNVHRMNKMTINDKIHAVALENDPNLVG